VFAGGIAKGLSAILVDNTGRGQARTVAEERAAGVRPYWVALRANDIIDLKTAFVGGGAALPRPHQGVPRPSATATPR
jgi:hypothetical protein